ncbi:class I SAM-dependent methyltransferase [Marilutibacter maris]|uniref:Methyltransferase type 12 n=1 Tax=Marilutibacter maris TaxID=1605891 RepID=A0A2U9TD73_9GAMM|nr:class I SAM-dependent methyltransferase [Lysobacter maris]AWV06190.1 Methyltransferase type 12 [Lysobacter maris]
MTPFSDPDAVARYAEGPIRQVPGFLALQTMATLLLAERVPTDGRVLVLGAGGGLELKAFAQAQPGWRLLGVDPSAPMLKLAADTLGPLAARAELLEGLIDDAPDTAFDGASCLLTLHFLPPAQRLHTLRQLRRRLKPGAPLVAAHHSVPADDGDDAGSDTTDDGSRQRWLRRYAAFATASGVPAADARRAIDAIAARLPLLTPQQDRALIEQAGFERVELFYAGFTFRGWVGVAG